MAEPFDTIVQDAYQRYLAGGVSNQRLREYFTACFQRCIEQYEAYPCWACINCLRQGQQTVQWGTKPRRCTVCNSGSVYEVATFQQRASVVGTAFGTALTYLMLNQYRLPLTPTPGNTRTHDYEVTPDIAIEAKGSPSAITSPDGTLTPLSRPGMERSDTRKKAFDNARTYRQRNPNGLFFVVSNAVPTDLVGYRNRDVNAVFDVTKVDRVEAMMTEIADRVDLAPLRQRRGL